MIERAQSWPGLFRRPTFTDWFTFVIAAGVSLFGLGLMSLSLEQPYVAILPFIALMCAVALWKYPSLSLFTLFAMATLAEHVREGTDPFTANTGFWLNLSSQGVSGIPVSPAELLMIAGMIIWCLRGLFSQTLKIHRSELFRSYGWYLLAVIAGFIHGTAGGSDWRISLWEIRTQFYGLAMFFLAANLLRSRRHIEVLGWIIIIGTGLKGLQGTLLYLISYGGQFTGNSLLDHDEAFFFPVYYIFVLLLFVFGGSRRQKQIGLVLLPAVMTADFANNRRGSTAILVIGLIVLWFMLFTIMKEHRVRILRWGLVALVLFSLYARVYWNSSSALAQPIQALKSQIAPTERDKRSDLYRQQEDQNLMFAISQHPIFGRGYGIPMENVAGMVNIEKIAPFILYMPHNSIMWVWWRLGLGGAILFWLALGLAIVRNCFLARTATDPYLRRWAIFATITIIMSLLMGWWDLGLFRYRVIVAAWTILAVPEVLERIGSESGAAQTSGGAMV